MKKISILIMTVFIMALMIFSPHALTDVNESQTVASGTSPQLLGTRVGDDLGVSYRAKVQTTGWETTWATNGNSAGTEGQSRVLEGIQIKLSGSNLPAGAEIEYRTHVKNTGWEKNWATDGRSAGSQGLDAIQIRLVSMPGYSVEYRVCLQNTGWENTWAADGENAGIVGQSLSLEAIEIRLIKTSSLVAEAFGTVAVSQSTSLPGNGLEGLDSYKIHELSKVGAAEVPVDPSAPGAVINSPETRVAAPEALAAAAGNHSISLIWNGVDGADSYKIYQAALSDGDYTEVTVGLTATAYEVPNLENGKRYYYKVKATAGGVDSQFSEAATAIASVDDQGNVLLGNQLLISNQSTDIETTQSTGTLSPGTEVMETAESDEAPFGIDRILPFEPAEGQKPIDPNDPSVLGTSDVYDVNSTKDFYTYNFETGNTDQIQARLAYVGTHVQIWVDANDPKMMMTDEDARVMAEEFDNKMYPLVTENFYTESDVNSDGKIAILCYDIQDGYTGVRPNTNYTCGYFRAGDLFDSEYSNKMEVFYADTYPSIKKNGDTTDMTQIYGTLVHEFQHMVNFNAAWLIRDSEDTDVWLNEAFSLAAEDMYSGSAPFGGTDQSFASLYVGIYNTNDAIRNGRSLLKFDISDDPSYSNYILSYFFSQYLRTQVDSALGSGHNVKVFKEIMEDPGTRTAAVARVMQKYVDPNLTFGDILTNFRAAMVVRADSGVFGFNDEDVYDALSTPLYTGGSTNLLGGGAIVKAIDAPFTVPADQGTDINYLGIFR